MTDTIKPARIATVGGDYRVTLHRSARNRWLQNQDTYLPTSCPDPVATWHVPPAYALPRSIFRTWA